MALCGREVAMALVARTLCGALALVCAGSLSGGTAVPILERAVKSAPGGVGLASQRGPAEIPPEQQSPSTDVRVSVTEVGDDVDVEIVDTTGSLLGESGPGLSVTAGSAGIPAMVLAAYQAAAERLASEDPSCGLRWQVLAGIGKVESSHARGGQLNAAGVTVPAIIGPVLNGGPGVAAISDSDDGAWDGDVVWDRAVGPMQFIPGTWRGFGADADGDGVSDPHNVWDATLAAGRYLCAGGGDLRTEAGLRAALYRYNHSASYVNHVLAWINAYLDGEPTATPDRGPGDADAVPPNNVSREPEDPKDMDPGGKNHDDGDAKKPKDPTPEPPDDDDPPDGGDDPPDEDPPDGADPPPAGTVEVPDLVGMALAEAEAALEELDLVVEIVDEVVENPDEVGRVLAQDPEALSEVEPGAVVTLTVGVAPPPAETVEVPGLVGMALAEAEAALEQLGLVAEVVEQEVDDADQVGVVLAQDPGALSEVEPGAVVTLTVGVAPPPDLVEVPGLVGMALAEAEAALEQLGLMAEVVEQEVDDADQVGVVQAQDPEALSEVEPGAVVTLTVGVAPPELVGMTLAEAEEALAELDLDLDIEVVDEVVEDDAKVGKVLAQSPETLAELEPGDSVTLTVGAES
ncbi:MAG TPA: PASTA domain-containing protein [Jiangellaceae bacterium]